MCYLCLEERPRVFINFSHIDWLRYPVTVLTLALANWREVFTFSFLYHATHLRGRFLHWRWRVSASLHLPLPAPLLLFNQMLLDQMQMDWAELEYRLGQHVSLGASSVPTVVQTGQTIYLSIYFKVCLFTTIMHQYLEQETPGEGLVRSS